MLMTQSGASCVAGSFQVVGAVKEERSLAKGFGEDMWFSQNLKISWWVERSGWNTGTQSIQRYAGTVSVKLLKQRADILYWIWAVIGSQWRDWRRGWMWSLFGALKRRLAEEKTGRQRVTVISSSTQTTVHGIIIPDDDNNANNNNKNNNNNNNNNNVFL